VKQHLAAVRLLFDYLVTGQVMAMNPAAAVRGLKHVVKRGKTPVLSADQARVLRSYFQLLSASVDVTDSRNARGISAAGDWATPAAHSWYASQSDPSARFRPYRLVRQVPKSPCAALSPPSRNQDPRGA
jgi:hypothetical protein